MQNAEAGQVVNTDGRSTSRPPYYLLRGGLIFEVHCTYSKISPSPVWAMSDAEKGAFCGEDMVVQSALHLFKLVIPEFVKWQNFYTQICIGKMVPQSDVLTII